MGRRRASNTIGLLGGGGGLTEGHHSTEVRKIDNGHIVRTSTHNSATGEHSSSERFVKSPSELMSRGSTLKDAVDYAGRR